MSREITATAVRRKLGGLLDEVRYHKGRIVITKRGPVAALIDSALFERLNKLDEEFGRLCGALASAFAGIGPAEGQLLAGKAVKASRRSKRRRGS